MTTLPSHLPRRERVPKKRKRPAADAGQGTSDTAGSLAPSEDGLGDPGGSLAPSEDQGDEGSDSSAEAPETDDAAELALDEDVGPGEDNGSTAIGGDGVVRQSADSSALPNDRDSGAAFGSPAPGGDLDHALDARDPVGFAVGGILAAPASDRSVIDRDDEEMTTSSPAGETTGGDRTEDVIIEQGQRLRRVSPRQLALLRRAAAAAPPPPVEEEPVNTNFGDVPQEIDDVRPEHAAMGDVEAAPGEVLPDTAGRAPPRTLTDICATYPIGNGLHYIEVQRRKPEVFQGIPCAGWMGEIHRSMTNAEFRNVYGGGLYEITVYGPDPRGKSDPMTGRPLIKSLTKPIPFRVPGNPTAETLAGEPARRGGGGMFPGSPFGSALRGGSPPATSADAQIHRDALHVTADLLKDERKRSDQLRDQNARQDPMPVVNAVRDAGREAADILREQLNKATKDKEDLAQRYERQLDELRAEIRNIASRPTEASSAWSALAQVAGAVAPGKHAGEDLQRMHDAHRDELRRLDEAHRREQKDARESFDERVRVLQAQVESDRARAKEDLKDAAARFEAREKEMRESFEARFREQRERFERREKEIEDRHRSDLDRLRGEHERELRSKDSQHELVRATERQGYEGRISQLKDKIETLKEDVGKARDEVERKGDFLEQFADLEKKAAVFGYVKQDASAPVTWQDRLADAFGQALRNADKIAANVASTFKDRKEAAAYNAALAQAQAQPGGGGAPGLPAHQPQAQAQAAGPQGPARVIRGPGGQPVRAARMIWGTPDMSVAPTPGAVGKPVLHPDARGPEPVAQVIQQPVTEAPEPQPQQEQGPPPQMHVIAQPQVAAPQPQYQAPQQTPPRPQPAAAQPQPQQPNGNGAFPVSPALMEQFRLWAESQIENKADPVEFAREFVAQLGVEQAAQVLLPLKVDALFDAFAATPQLHASPILRRDGQAFMRKAWAEGKRICEEAMGSQPS